MLGWPVMRFALVGVVATLVVTVSSGCTSDSSLCADVSCPIAGTVCDEADGLCHCGVGGEVCSEGLACDVAETSCYAPLPAAQCTDGTRWSAGTPAFREVTGEWGLSGVLGVRLNVTDIDGDGSADLVVRRGGPRPDDFGPDGTRRTWLLRNTGSGFEDVSESSGLLQMRAPLPNTGRPVEIVAFGDVDNDGDLDAYLGLNTTNDEHSLSETSEIMLNDGTGQFTFAPGGAARNTERFDVPAGASFVDYDRDGNLDLWVPQHNFTNASDTVVFMQDRLYRGDGAGGFADVTDAVGLTTVQWTSISDLNTARSHSRAWGSLARDLDGDGTPELMAPSYGRSPNHLWQGVRASDGTVQFQNRSVESGYAFDDDLEWESNQFARCYCQSNRSAEGCADVGPPAIGCSSLNWQHAQDREPFRLGGNSGATSAGDVDGDGDLDLFQGEIRHWWAGAGSDGSELLVNEGALSFSRPGDEAMGMAVPHSGASWDEGHMTNALFDFDNDGRLDVYVGASDYAGNRGLLYHQSGEMSFTEVPTTDFFEHNRSHGVVVADFDRDGDVDVVVGHSRSRCDAALPNDCYETPQVRMFENVMPAGNWLQLELVGGEGSNRAAIGAQVTVSADGRTQLLEVDGGHGHYGSQSDLVLHAGLGGACEAEVTVRWPDAELSTETFTLPAGHRIRLVQGERPTIAD